MFGFRNKVLWVDAGERSFDEPLPETGAVLRRDELERMRADSYRLRGWDGEGRPPTAGSDR